MKSFALIAFVLALTDGAIAQSPWDRGRLQVSDNGRYLQHADGTLFFWLGDTVWLLFQKMDRDEVRTYFENRKRKGFNCLRTQLRQAGTQKRGTQAGQREFTLRMGTISGAEVAASWFNPRTGATTQAGTHKNSGTIAFDPPGVKANGNDWVLVLDDTATRFPAPGAGTLH